MAQDTSLQSTIVWLVSQKRCFLHLEKGKNSVSPMTFSTIIFVYVNLNDGSKFKKLTIPEDLKFLENLQTFKIFEICILSNIFIVDYMDFSESHQCEDVMEK